MSKNILLTLLLLSPLAFADDKFVEMHLLAVDSVWVRGMNMSIPILSKDYDCGFTNENGSYAENVKSSSKRYYYLSTGIDPINPKSSLRDYLIKTNDRNFYCGFNDRAEAMKAIRAVMLKCINSGWDSCLIGGTGDKETDGWMMLGGNSLKREQLIKEKFVLNQNKIQQELKQKQLQAKQDEFMAYIESLKNNCITYGFTSDNAIATCVQREINLERDRVQAQQIAKQNQPIIQQVQPSYRNSGPNSNALKSMGSCLQTEGSFAACANAWQGYTPPKKTVTNCRYDAFGNTIRGTCTTQ